MLQITFFTVILSHVPFLQKDKYRNGNLLAGSHNCLRCFGTCEHDLEIGKLFSIVRLENDRQCQFIIVSAYISVTVTVTCLLSIQISSMESMDLIVGSISSLEINDSLNETRSAKSLRIYLNYYAATLQILTDVCV